MAQIRAVPYDDSLAATWDSFIDGSVNGTLFHKRLFINYHPEGKFQDASFLFYEANKLVAVFPAAIIQSADGTKVLKSHPGTSYGGLVFDKPLQLAEMFSVLESLDAQAKELQVDRIEFRQGPKIFNKLLIDQFDFALVHLGYEKKEQELATFFPLEHFEIAPALESFIMQFPQKNRNEIRKGIKEGLVFRNVSGEQEILAFYEMLSRSLESKFKKKPTHTFEELRRVLQLMPEHCFIAGVFNGDIPAAGFLVMKMNQQGWHIFYAPMNYELQHLRPLNFGVANLIFLALNKGMKVLNYGISTEQGGSYINWSLYKFKENFNGTGAIRTYWIKQLTS